MGAGVVSVRGDSVGADVGVVVVGLCVAPFGRGDSVGASVGASVGDVVVGLCVAPFGRGDSVGADVVTESLHSESAIDQDYNGDGAGNDTGEANEPVNATSCTRVAQRDEGADH